MRACGQGKPSYARAVGADRYVLVWDLDRWLVLLHPEKDTAEKSATGSIVGRAGVGPDDSAATTPIDPSLWRVCGTGILAFYGLSCILYGGVYRPRGTDLENPAFYVLVMIALFPVLTLLVEQRRRACSPGS